MEAEPLRLVLYWFTGMATYPSSRPDTVVDSLLSIVILLPKDDMFIIMEYASTSIKQTGALSRQYQGTSSRISGHVGCDGSCNHVPLTRTKI